MTKTYKILIGGKWVSSESKETFQSLNPATEKILGRFQSGNENDVNQAVDAAERAFEGWSSLPAPKRGEILFRLASLLKENKESLARTVTNEMGKVLSEARGDVQEAIDITEYMAGEGRRLFGRTTPSELRDKFCMTVRRPIGVCGLITPWNFPTAIPAWKIMPALICGNTIVFKPASDTPLCAIKFVEILEKAGVPKGVINLVTGSGEQAGTPIVRHKSIRCISFTGSRDTGLQITKEAGIKKVGLELGGKNGIIILEDADLNLAIDGVIWGGYGTTGQRCTAASRVIVQQSIKERFEKLLSERVSRLRLGNGLDSKTDVGPMINKKAVEKTHSYTEIGIKEGAKLLCGGHTFGKKGFFYQPTLFTDVTYNMRIAQEEIFGPTVCIISVKNLEEAIEVMNSVTYGLSSSIYTSNMRSAFKAIEGIEAGLTYVNSSTIGSEAHLPFGGVKQTGSTREAGWTALEEFSEIKTVYFDYSGKLQKAQIDTG
ncbi:MAG: aldehyde dehydrogenase family protein [Candidatus Aenigmarchaeota archaeon]|nr:aldehyde dehydrogenase family protein [Candidatus Aenigmarchaeota archaeon]